jgi:hypothetical protein
MKQRSLHFGLALAALLMFGAANASATATLRAFVNGSAVDLDPGVGVITQCPDQTAACDSNATVNIVHSVGSLLGVNIDFTGTTKTGCVNCLMDLNTLTIAAAGNQIVDLDLSDIGFTSTGGFNMFFSATVPVGASATATLFGGNSNTLFDISATRGIIGPFVSPGSAASGAGTPNTVNPYSLTQRIHIAFGPNGGTFSGDFNVSQVPEPTSIVLLGSMLLGLGTTIRRKMIASKKA